MARHTLLSLAVAAFVLSAAAPAKAQDCSLPCSCAFGVAFGEDLSGYANTTWDVRDFRAALAGGTPDFADALAIYTNGRHAFRGGNLPRQMQRAARSNYGAETYYKLASTYYNSATYLDTNFFIPMLKGEGEYANACCGVRAEAARAAALWYSFLYAIHEVDAGVCYATGCNNRTINYELASEEILHGMALATGANGAGITDGPQGTSNPDTLFQRSNAVGALFCTKKRKDELSQINVVTIAAHQAASDAAKAKDMATLANMYKDIEEVYIARFLALSLEQARLANKKPSRGAIRKADACRKDCIGGSQQAAAKIYWKAVAPIVARDQPSLAAAVDKILDGPTLVKQYKPLVAAYKSISEAYTVNFKTYVAKCKA